MAEAIIDIPDIPRINHLESVNPRRHSTGKVFMPNGEVTVVSRYLRASQGSCHDICKYGTRCSFQTESNDTRSSMPKTKRAGGGQTLERIESNLGERRRKSEVSPKLSDDFKIREPNDPVVIKIAKAQGGHHEENAEANLSYRKKPEIIVERSGYTKPQTPDHLVIKIAKAQGGHHEENAEANLSYRKKPEIIVERSGYTKPQTPDHLVIKIAKAQGGHHEENAEANLSYRKKPEIIVERSGYTKPQTPDHLVLSLEPSADDLVDIKTIAEENAETKFTEGEKELQVSMKSSSDCIESELSSCTDKESVVSPSPKKVPLPVNETDVAVAHARDSKLKTRSKPSSLLRQSCSSGNLNTEGSKSMETDLMFTTPVPSRKRTSVMGDGKYVVAPSLKESSTSTSSMNVRKWKSIGVCHSKKLENAKQIKPENDKGSKNQKGASHLMGQKNAKKHNSEESSFEDITEKTLYMNESNPVQNSVHGSNFCTMPSSSSEGKSMKHTRNRIPIGRSPQSNGKEKMIYRPKGIHGHGLPPSFPGKKGLRSTPYGQCVTQPSLAASLPLISTKYLSMSPYGDAPSQHDKVVAQKKNSSSKMMYRVRPKLALMTTSEDKQRVFMQGEKLNFQRRKVIGFSERKGESNPENKPSKSIQNSVHAGHFSTMSSSSSKEKGMKLTRNRISTGRSPQSYEKKNMIPRPKGIHVRGLPPSLSSFPGKKGLRSTPYGLNVTRQPLASSSSSLTSSPSPHHDASLSQHDEVAEQKQKSSSKMMYKGRPKMALINTSTDKHLQGARLNFQRGKMMEAPVEDCTPRRLAFKRRVLIDNKNGDDRREKIEDCSPRRLNFRLREPVDNRNGDNKNGGEEFSPRRLKFRRRAVVDNNRNADNQNDKGDHQDFITRKLKFWRKVLDDNNSEGKKADVVGRDKATEVEPSKNILKRSVSDVGKKKDSGNLYNNMIEETTSRFARTNASKVKALVSAFETVISDLDNTKISTTSSTH
ncbi:hypothetical protein PTKIN_Ptkin05aG0176200 [Pterospermum kingtungense]